MSPSVWPFQSPSAHESVSGIIRRRSTNSTDVRLAAIGDLDLASARKVLDLGCGFGFMAEALGDCIAPDAEIVGIDLWPTNEAPFLAKVSATGRRGRFFCAEVGSTFPCPDGTYDLVVSSYSLYFFVGALPEVARILAPEGLFLAITHSERSFIGLLRAAGLHPDKSPLLSLGHRFSAENGREQLGEWFGEVNRVDYQNSLHFDAEHADELLAYLRFKLPLMVAGVSPGDDLPKEIETAARGALSRFGAVVVEKDDAIFRCRRPVCR